MLYLSCNRTPGTFQRLNTFNQGSSLSSIINTSTCRPCDSCKVPSEHSKAATMEPTQNRRLSPTWNFLTPLNGGRFWRCAPRIQRQFRPTNLPKRHAFVLFAAESAGHWSPEHSNSIIWDWYVIVTDHLSKHQQVPIVQRNWRLLADKSFFVPIEAQGCSGCRVLHSSWN